MSTEHKKNVVPCVLFAYNRPDKFARVVSAMRTQNVDHIIVFIDGPRDRSTAGKVKECRRIAKGIDWVSVDYVFKERNEGLAGIINNIGAVFRSYDSAVFVEDDCLPMPAFYSVMKRALRHYADDTRGLFRRGVSTDIGRFFQVLPLFVRELGTFYVLGVGFVAQSLGANRPLLFKRQGRYGGLLRYPRYRGR